MIRVFLFLFILSLLHFSCNNDEPKHENSPPQETDSMVYIKDFYFPVDELKKGMVYEYVDANKEIPVEYWYYTTTFDEAGDKYLVGMRYGPDFRQQVLRREWIIADGTILKDYRFYMLDSTTMKMVDSQAEIVKNVTYPFKAVRDTTRAYQMQIKFQIWPDTTMNYDLLKNRKFDKFVNYEYDGKEYEAVQLVSAEYMNAYGDGVNEGGDWNRSYKSKEIYARGIGLVYLEKSGDIEFKLRLNRRFPMSEFEKLQQQR